MAAATFLGFYLIVAQFAGVDLAATLSEADWAWVVVACALLVRAAVLRVGRAHGHGEPAPSVRARPRRAVRQQLHRPHRRHGGEHRARHPVLPEAGPEGRGRGQLGRHELAGRRHRPGRARHRRAAAAPTPSSCPPRPAAAASASVILIAIVVIGVAVDDRAARARSCAPRSVARSARRSLAARENLQGILTTPRKALMIFGGNLCSQVAFALVLDAALRAYGALAAARRPHHHQLARLAARRHGAGAGRHGRDRGRPHRRHDRRRRPAVRGVAATFTARLFTTYLSPIWGWVALQWLRRHDYV